MRKIFVISFFVLFVNVVNAQWQQTSLDSCAADCITTDGTNIFAGVYIDKLFRSTDGGNTWLQVDNNRPIYDVICVSIFDSIVFIGTPNGVYASTDNGNSWTSRNNGLPQISPAAYTFAIKDSIIFVSIVHEGIYYTTDYGNTWASFDNGLNTFVIHTLTIRDSLIYTGSYGSGVKVSNIYNINWNFVNNNLSDMYIKSMNSINSTLFAGTNTKGIFRYNDISNSWDSINNGLPQYSRVHSIVNYGNDIIICASDLLAFNGSVYLSNDNGNYWFNIGSGLPSTTINSLALDDNFIYAATSGYGVWKRPLSEINSIESNPLCDDFIIFPNPTNGYITIKNISSIKTIEIINMLGVVVYSDLTTSSGKNVEVDLSYLPKGLYVIKVGTERNTLTKKLIIE